MENLVFFGTEWIKQETIRKVSYDKTVNSNRKLLNWIKVGEHLDFGTLRVKIAILPFNIQQSVFVAVYNKMLTF